MSSSIRTALLILLVSAGLILFASAALALGTDVSAGLDVGTVDSMDLGAVGGGAIPSEVPVSAVPSVDPGVIGPVSGVGLVDGVLADALGLAEGPAGEVVGGDASSASDAGRVSTTQAGPASYIATGAKSGALALGATGLLGALLWAKEAIALGASRFLVAPLFSRIDKDEMLENEGRESLYTHITANPGVSLSELAERSGLGWGTTVYHLGRLEQAGFVTSIKSGQSRLFFQKDHGAVQNKRAIAVLRNQTASDVARFLLATPGATQSTIGRSLGLGAPTVTKYVKRFEAEGLVQVTADGRHKIVQATPTLGAVMVHMDAPAPTVGIAAPSTDEAPALVA